MKKCNKKKERAPPPKSKFEAVVTQERYRVSDSCRASCCHGPAAVMCAASGKVGRNGRVAAIGATQFWLVCPSLNNIIARFERHGVVAMLTQRLSADPALLCAHVESHKKYEALVLSLLSAEQAEFFTAHFLDCPDEAKRKFGNAGVGHEGDLKCVHALVAQSLGGASNPLGNLILKYIVALEEQVRSACSEEVRTIMACEDLGSNPSISAKIDDVANIERFLDSEGLGNVVEDNLQDGVARDEFCTRVCAKAEWLLQQAEGHFLRARKKHRKN